MADESEKVPVKKSGRGSLAPSEDFWQPLARLRSDMEKVFEDFFSSMPFPFGGRRGETEPTRTFERLLGPAAPAIDLVEKENTYEVIAELPGLDEKDVDLTLSDDVLTIKGEKKEEREEKRKGYHFAERHFGSFRRSLRLPEDVDQQKIEAVFKKGLLTITLPKNPSLAKQEKKISIKAE
jgi:HSP20 family protein